MIWLLDRILFGWPRRFYFDRIRGNFVKSYRIARIDLAAGISGTEMWRYLIQVRYKYTWYHSANDGTCEAEGFNLKPKKELIKDMAEVQVLLSQIVRGCKNRERIERTKTNYRKQQSFSAVSRKVEAKNAY